MKYIEVSIMGVGSSIPPLHSDGGALVFDPADKDAHLNNFLKGSGLGMLLTSMLPVIAGPNFKLFHLSPEKFVGCFLSLILTVEFVSKNFVLCFSRN